MDIILPSLTVDPTALANDLLVRPSFPLYRILRHVRPLAPVRCSLYFHYLLALSS
jgi:hypothetical protein